MKTIMSRGSPLMLIAIVMLVTILVSTVMVASPAMVMSRAAPTTILSAIASTTNHSLGIQTVSPVSRSSTTFNSSIMQSAYGKQSGEITVALMSCAAQKSEALTVSQTITANAYCNVTVTELPVTAISCNGPPTLTVAFEQENPTMPMIATTEILNATITNTEAGGTTNVTATNSADINMVLNNSAMIDVSARMPQVLRL